MKGTYKYCFDFYNSVEISFQLLFGGLEDCQSWIVSKLSIIDMNFVKCIHLYNLMYFVILMHMVYIINSHFTGTEQWNTFANVKENYFQCSMDKITTKLSRRSWNQSTDDQQQSSMQ